MKKLLQKVRRGFTLIELLVVISIIGILAAMLFPVFGKVREGAYRTKCQSNLHQLALAIGQYYDDNSQTMPGGTLQGLQSLSNYIANAAQIFACPSDVAYGTKTLSTNMLSLTAANISYWYCANPWQSSGGTYPVFWDRGGPLGGGIWPPTPGAAGSAHLNCGFVLMTDGHVERETNFVGAIISGSTNANYVSP